MLIVWLLTGLSLTTFACEWCLRRYSMYKIADIFENVPPFNVVAESQTPSARLLSVTTCDGIRLSGSLHWPEQATPYGLVLFFHELSGNHWMSRRYCEALLNDGFAILAFDFRNQGQSEAVAGYQPIHWITEYELNDIAGVMEYVESDPELSTMPLLAYGVSRGGVAALLAGSRYPRIRAVVADSAFGTMPMARHFVERFVRYVIPSWVYAALPEWHIRLALKQGLQVSETRRDCRYVHLENESSGLAETPVLLIAGKRDSYVTPHVAQQLQDLIGPTAELWLVDHAKHNLARSAATEEYDRRIVNHAHQALGLDAVTPAEMTSSEVPSAVSA